MGKARDAGLTPSEYAESLTLLMGKGCPTPDKKRFPSFEGACRWRDMAKRKAKAGDEWHNSLYPYKCIATGHWHLTKTPVKGW